MLQLHCEKRGRGKITTCLNVSTTLDSSSSHTWTGTPHLRQYCHFWGKWHSLCGPAWACSSVSASLIMQIVKNTNFPPSPSHSHVDGADSWNHSVTGWLSGTILPLSFRFHLTIHLCQSIPNHYLRVGAFLFIFLRTEYFIFIYQSIFFHLFSLTFIQTY